MSDAVTSPSGTPKSGLPMTADVLRHAGNLIEIPDEHLEAGIDEPVDPAPLAQDPFIRIRSSKTRPDGAQVAVFLHGWWFYIDRTDARSKRSFALIRLLISLRLESQSSEQRAPVLTVPVG